MRRLPRARSACVSLFATLLPLAALAHPTPATAAADTAKVPFDDDFDACGGERVRVSGIQAIVGRVTQDGQGRWHFGFTRNTRGTGVGAVSGAEYVLNDAVTRSSVEITPGEPKTFHEGYTARLIRKGESGGTDDSYVHFLSTITVNANGDVTAAVSIQKAACK